MSAKILGKIDISDQRMEELAKKRRDEPLKLSLGELIKCVFCPSCKRKVPMEFVKDDGYCMECR